MLLARVSIFGVLLGTWGLFTIAPDASRAQQFDDVEIEATSLGSGLHILTGAGGNLGVSVGPDGIFLVDDQYAPLTPKIKAAVAKLGEGPIRFVLNTHWHGDHTGGNENLAGEGALIVAHENVRERMSSEQFMAAFDRRVPASPPAALPVVTFDTGVTFHVNGQEIHAFHVDPAHTDGDAVVHFREANVLHMGDTYFSGMYPFFDLSSGGDFDGLIAAVEKVLPLCDDATKIIPGHGPLSGRQELVAYRDMLLAVRTSVQAGIDSGQTLEQIVAARPTAELDSAWARGFIKPDVLVKMVHASLTRAR